jgi:hypothetical protein
MGIASPFLRFFLFASKSYAIFILKILSLIINGIENDLKVTYKKFGACLSIVGGRRKPAIPRPDFSSCHAKKYRV